MSLNFRSRQRSSENVYFSSLESIILPGVEEAEEPVLEGEHFFQKEQNPIAQTSEENVSKVCRNEPPSESHSHQQARSFDVQYCGAVRNDRKKSVCLSSIKTTGFALAMFVTLLAVCAISAAIAVISRGKLSDNRI